MGLGGTLEPICPAVSYGLLRNCSGGKSDRKKGTYHVPPSTCIIPIHIHIPQSLHIELGQVLT